MRVRISILAFDDAPALWRAAHELLINGFISGQFCIIGLALPIAKLDPLSALDHDLRSLLMGPTANRATLVLPSSGAIVEALCGHHDASVLETLGDRHGGCVWIRPEIGLSFEGDVALGHVVLVVTSDSADQQEFGARILLRHGRHDLKTHEFSIPRPAST